MEMKPVVDFLQTTPGLIARFLVGLLLVLMGLKLIPLTPAPTALAANEPAVERSQTSAPPAAASYRLLYDPQQGAWLVAPLGGDEELLTDLVPDPGKVDIPSGYVDREQVRATLLEVLRKRAVRLDSEDRQRLLERQLDGSPLFRPEDLKPADNG